MSNLVLLFIDPVVFVVIVVKTFYFDVFCIFCYIANICCKYGCGYCALLYYSTHCAKYVSQKIDLFCCLQCRHQICCCPSIRDICIYALMSTRRGFRLYSLCSFIKKKSKIRTRQIH